MWINKTKREERTVKSVNDRYEQEPRQSTYYSTTITEQAIKVAKNNGSLLQRFWYCLLQLAAITAPSNIQNNTRNT